MACVSVVRDLELIPMKRVSLNARWPRAFVAISLVLWLRGPASAQARPLPESEWNQATQLTLAQIMVGEADWHEPDHVAIAYVLARRWQQYRQRHPISFRRYIRLYSSTMKVDTERAR